MRIVDITILALIVFQSICCFSCSSKIDDKDRAFTDFGQIDYNRIDCGELIKDGTFISLLKIDEIKLNTSGEGFLMGLMDIKYNKGKFYTVGLNDTYITVFDST